MTITNGTKLEVIQGCKAYGPMGAKGSVGLVTSVEYKPLVGAVRIVISMANGRRNLATTFVVWLRYAKHLNNETIRVHRGNPLEALTLKVAA